MNTNNKEIIELLRIAKSHVTDGYEASACALIEKCMSLLQDNEDTVEHIHRFYNHKCSCGAEVVFDNTEVQEEGRLGTVDDWINIHTNGTCKKANDCLISLAQSINPSSKVEKLNRLMVDVEQGENLREAMIRLIELIEDEE